MIKSLLLNSSLIIMLSACSTPSKKYQQPSNLLFQNKNIQTKTIQVERDSKLCKNDQIHQQNCPTYFYIDGFKAGDFYINNQAQYHLKPNEYILKVKNCNKKCTTTELKYRVNEQLINQKITLSIDQNGLPIIIQSDLKVAAAPIDEPVIHSLAIPVPATIEETSEFQLGADTLFKFDRANLEDLLTAGRLELDELAKKISSEYVTVRSIHLVGHTDRLGSESYNFNLAQRRANTVRDYLQKSGVPAQSMTTASAGKSEPVTQGCYGITPRQVLHACLQPDRRVVVKITGVRKR